MKTERITPPREATQAMTGKADIIKLDFEMGLESFFNTLMAISGVAIAVLLWVGLIGGKRSPPVPEVLPFVWIPAPVLVLAASLRGCTEVHRFIDPDERALFQSTRFLNWRWVKKLGDSRSTVGVGPMGRLVRSKHSQSWHYEIVLLRKGGKPVRLTRSVCFKVEHKFFTEKDASPAEQEAVEDLNRKAGQFAAALACPSFAGRPRTEFAG
ncbi:MAG: hypothetical protein HYY23_14765 [Verrucomicrobia bacterium]|nr:hypothetical protein [Verrucomicrobiota bacterium]